MVFPLLVTWFSAVHCSSRKPQETLHQVPAERDGSPQIEPSQPAETPHASTNKTRAVPSALPDIPPLRAAEYSLTLLARRGSRVGATSRGTLTLVPGTAGDTSKVTGEMAQDLGPPPLLYGWTDIDFQRVAAPMCKGPSPSATSRDPVRPGVLVPAIPFHDHTMVLVGTVMNLRDGSSYVDGCGIALFVERWDSGCYQGAWDAFGIAINGSGTFRACSVQTPATP
jgi:hypothetical protein